MAQYSANARSWFGPGWVTYIQTKPPVQTVQNQGADRAFPNGSYGGMIPQVYGRGRVNGNILWYGEAVPIDTPTPLQGGATSTETAYEGTFAVALCKGPIDSIIRIWADDLLIYDATASGPSVLYGTTTIYLGDETQTPDPVMESFEGAGNVPGYRGVAFILFYKMPLKDFGNRIPAISAEVQAQTSASVESILNAMAAQTGLPVSDFDFGCLDATVTGYVMTNRAPAKQIIEELLNIFAADLVEFDGRLQVIVRGKAPLATVPLSDMGAKVWQGHDSSPQAAVVVTRLQDLELPFRLDLNYYSADKGYDRTTTFGLRYDKPDVQSQVTVESGLVLTEDQARAIVERLLYQQWIERTSYAVSLMPSYLRFVPAAVLVLPVEDEEVRVRVVQMDISLFGPIGVQAVRDDTGYLTQSVPGAAVETNAPALANPVATTFHAFDSIEFNDTDAASAGFYVANTGPSGWRSADIYYSTDATHYVFAARTGLPNVFGHAASVLADGVTAGVFDLTSTVNVVLDVTGALSSAASAAVSEGVNLALVGAELLGFTTATLIDAPTRTYTLSGLLRGLRATPMTGHANPEPFVMASPAPVRVALASALIGATVYVKSVSHGASVGSVIAQPVVIGTPHVI